MSRNAELLKQVIEGNAKRDAVLMERQGIGNCISCWCIRLHRPTKYHAPKEPAIVPDSVIAQLKQCKPDCKINNTGSNWSC